MGHSSLLAYKPGAAREAAQQYREVPI